MSWNSHKDEGQDQAPVAFKTRLFRSGVGTKHAHVTPNIRRQSGKALALPVVERNGQSQERGGDTAASRRTALSSQECGGEPPAEAAAGSGAIPGPWRVGHSNSYPQTIEPLTWSFRIFVPTNRTTLVDILLGKKEASPKKSRRSRSRSVSPHKQPASPTTGRGKRVSISSSAAIAAGEIFVSQSELRRSPRKKSTAASRRSSTGRKKTAGAWPHSAPYS